MTCCAGNDFKESQITGTCIECGKPIVDIGGEKVPFECCPYSPTECETCGWAPCDLSC